MSRVNKINNNSSINIKMDDQLKKPAKRRKKKDCKYCRNKELENAQKHTTIISVSFDDSDDIFDKSTKDIDKQRNYCQTEFKSQQTLPVLDNILSDEKMISMSTEKYWPRMMKTNSIYSEDYSQQRKLKNIDLSKDSPMKIKKLRRHWLENIAYQMNVMRGCNGIKFIIIFIILSLLTMGAIALYIVFEPEKVHIIKQYFHLSRGINNSFVNYTDQPQRFIANINRVENLTVSNESLKKTTSNNYEQDKIEKTILNSITIRHCNNCYEGEICIALNNDNVPTCKIPNNINNITGCGEMCDIEEKCHQLDTNIFRCLKVEHRCLDDEWRCSNMLCIPLVKLCDGHMNCYDHSDEYNCDCNHQTHFQCGKNTSCLPLMQRCDGKIDCWDASDEINCSLCKNTQH
ncbi:hypothetical protein PV327_006133 [Microctonus hyperodae]|uniref:Uncharacterized protein n=1 Tax=Microctonus hyperodae TaxID=165561 RepID=A0AA39G3N5_MICHY|nr:hypothetical protein PV327_006133 [Microctonus hyperodae]